MSVPIIYFEINPSVIISTISSNANWIVILVKKFPNSDLTLSGFIGSTLVIIYALFVCDNIVVSRNDFYLAFIAGIFQNGLPFILLVLASKYISSVVIGLTMLLEAVLGPIWAYLFIKDIPTLKVFIGGIFILIGVILRLYFTIYKNKMRVGFRWMTKLGIK